MIGRHHPGVESDLHGDLAIQSGRPVAWSSRALWQVGRIAASRPIAARKWRSNARSWEGAHHVRPDGVDQGVAGASDVE